MRSLVWKCLFGVVGLAGTSAALAAWSSGGGELIKDSHNPWFLQNVERVRYCIIRDENHFQLNEKEGFPLDTLVSKAIQFWKDEFSRAHNPLGNEKDGVRVATQEFTLVDCSKDVDIKFQFGFLYPSQLKEMKEQGLDPREHVSFAIRTEYDQVNLKGKGFIYLAADSGPLKPNSDEILDHPWAEGSGAYIYKILVHELGHIFGLQHQSDVFSFMAPEFPESLVNKTSRGGANTSPYSYYLPSFFKFTQLKDVAMCINLEIQPVAARFFGISKDWDCYETRLINESEMEIWGVNDDKQDLIGSAKFTPEDAARFDFPVRVWLPDQQKIYPPNSQRHGRSLFGPMIKHSNLKGVYKNKDSNIERQISVYLSPILGWNKIAGIMDGTQYIDIQANQ